MRALEILSGGEEICTALEYVAKAHILRNKEIGCVNIQLNHIPNTAKSDLAITFTEAGERWTLFVPFELVGDNDPFIIEEYTKIIEHVYCAGTRQLETFGIKVELES